MAPEETWDDGNDSADSTQQAEEQQVQENELSRSHTFVSGDDNSPDEEDEEDGAEYDPESVTTSMLPSAAPTVQQQPKPKVSGGFLVGSSDDEDEEEPVAIRTADHARSPLHQPVLAVEGEPGSAQLPNRKRSVSGALKSPPLNMSVRSPQAPPQVEDKLTTLEARIAEDPRGDMDAWLALIEEHRRREVPDDIRAVYGRFLETFPQSAEIWAEWVEWELGHDNFVTAEQLFGRSLLSVPNINLWTVYLNYIRRRNDLTNDPMGQARKTVTQSYEFVIDTIGHDKDSGKIWSDYIQFLKSGPGNIGGNNWQDQQKMDQLRKAYQRAISVPMSAVNTLWKEYDQFEMGLNKLTGRKFIQDRSPSYMSAKSANIALENMTRNLRRTTIPRLPPAPGFAGDDEYKEQIALWRQWIQWEIDDPLVLKLDEPAAYYQRVLYCYKQALMALRFWPEMWVEAAEWAFKEKALKDGKEQGLKFLLQGVDANPESVLLAYKHGDQIERTHPDGEDEEVKSVRAAAVRQPYDKVLDALYAMANAAKEKEKAEIAKIEALNDDGSPHPSNNNNNNNNDDDEEEGQVGSVPNSAKDARIAAIADRYSAQIGILSKTISYVWIALARAMRRIQGKGAAKEGGLRKIFIDARTRGRLTSDVYVAVALIEWTVYKDPVGAKIFERGAKLFPEDADFILEYIRFLHSKDDTTNARVVFEQCVNRLTQNPENVYKAKLLYSYFHKYESQFGELAQIIKLEERMEELFPEDPRLVTFTSRYTTNKFDPISTRIIISAAIQLRPKAFLPHPMMPADTRDSTPAPYQRQPSPRPLLDSPKRPLEDDSDYNRPRKLARGESPLKGAAGRRLEQRRTQAALNLDITFLLSQLPPAHSYDFLRFSPQKLMGLLRETTVPDHRTWQATQNSGGGSSSHGRQPSGDYPSGYPSGYGRRESPAPSGRPRSPFDANPLPRVAGASGAYRNSPLRPDGYDGPASGYGEAPSWPPAPGGYGAPPPPNPYARPSW